MTEYESAEEYESACQREQNRYGRERPRTTASNMPPRGWWLVMAYPIVTFVLIILAVILIGVLK